MRLLRPWHHSAHLSPTSTLSHVSCTVSIYQNIRIYMQLYTCIPTWLKYTSDPNHRPIYPSCDWCFLFGFLLSIPYSLGTNDCRSLYLHWYLCPHIPYHTVNHSNVMMQRYNVLINLLYHPSHQPCHEFPTLPESTSGYVRTGSEPCACGLALTTWNQILLPGVLEVVAGCRYRFLEDLGIQTKMASYTNCRCFLIFALRLLQLPWPQGLHPVEPWKSLKLLVQRSVEQAQVLDQFMLKAQHIIFLCSFSQVLAWFMQLRNTPGVVCTTSWKKQNGPHP